MKNQILNLCVFGTIALFTACEPESQVDYVNLKIPPELAGNPEAIEALEKDAKQLNRLFNSLNDIMDGYLAIGEELAQIDENTDKEELKESLTGPALKLQRSFGKLALNAVYYGIKDDWEENHKEIIEKLKAGEKVVFYKSMKHIELKKGEFDKQLEIYGEKFRKLKLDLDRVKGLSKE